MITARSFGSYMNMTAANRPRLGVSNPNKNKIIEFMTSVEPSGIAEGYVRDFGADDMPVDKVDAGYDFEDLFWREEDIYNFERYDMELNPEFCARVLELAEADR